MVRRRAWLALREVENGGRESRRRLDVARVVEHECLWAVAETVSCLAGHS